MVNLFQYLLMLWMLCNPVPATHGCCTQASAWMMENNVDNADSSMQWEQLEAQLVPSLDASSLMKILWISALHVVQYAAVYVDSVLMACFRVLEMQHGKAHPILGHIQASTDMQGNRTHEQELHYKSWNHEKPHLFTWIFKWGQMQSWCTQWQTTECHECGPPVGV